MITYSPSCLGTTPSPQLQKFGSVGYSKGSIINTSNYIHVDTNINTQSLMQSFNTNVSFFQTYLLIPSWCVTHAS